MAVLTPEAVVLTDFDRNPTGCKVQHIPWDPIEAEHAGYKHFMLKKNLGAAASDL
jgi:glutamine---fructose-6-phosphate transaminase (isomerizing)